MKFFIIIALFFYFLPSCTTKSNETNNDLVLSDRDSLVFMNELFDSLEVELKSRYKKSMNISSTCICFCGIGSHVKVKVTSSNEVYLNDSICSNLSSSICAIYTKNFHSNLIMKNFVLYGFLSKNEIKEEHKLCQNGIDKLRKDQSKNPKGSEAYLGYEDFIKVKNKNLQRWQILLDALAYAGKNKIHQSNATNEVYVSYPDDYLFKTELKDSILHGFYQIRNEFTTYYFEKTYLQLFAENRTKKSKENQIKLDALKIIYPFLVISPEMPSPVGLIEVPVP